MLVGGESALRLDVPSGRLHAFGASFAIDEAFVVLAGTLLATAAFLLVTLLYGRVWCGWSCPQTVLGDLTRWSGEPGRRAAERPVAAAGGLAVVALVSAVVAASVLWYFVSPTSSSAGSPLARSGPCSWRGSRSRRCCSRTSPPCGRRSARRSARTRSCRASSSTGTRSWSRTIAIADDCVDCGACVRVCPTGIDIRDGLQMECIACAACVDACAPIMAKLRRPPGLVRYSFGEPGTPGRLARPGIVALAGATAAALVLVVAVVAGRAVIDMNALAEAAFVPRRAADGRVVNVFSVALENRGRGPRRTAARSAPRRRR